MKPKKRDETKHTQLMKLMKPNNAMKPKQIKNQNEVSETKKRDDTKHKNKQQTNSEIDEAKKT